MHVNELSIPPIAASDEKAIELLRVWAAKSAQHVSIATQIWDDPQAWGLMLVDLAKHIANAYHETRGDDINTVLKQIKAGLDAEWRSPTDTPSGGLISDDK